MSLCLSEKTEAEMQDRQQRSKHIPNPEAPKVEATITITSAVPRSDRVVTRL